MTLGARQHARDQHGAMMARFLGARVVDAFADDDITEIYLNPQDGAVRFDTRTHGKVDSGTRLDAHRVEMFLNAVAASQNTVVGPDQPRLEAELPPAHFRGSRLQGFVPPVTSAPAFAVRKPPQRVLSLDDYVAAEVMTRVERSALAHAVAEHRNILVAGGTNSGKTTLTNAILREITEAFPQERIVVLEDTVELQCTAADHLALRTGSRLSLADLVRSTMRVSPNRIIVGEVRGSEALELLDVWATGHPGGVATIHAASPEGALLRLDRLARRANVPSQRELIAEAIHLIVIIQGGNQGRRVTGIARVAGLDPSGAFSIDYLTSSGGWA